MAILESGENMTGRVEWKLDMMAVGWKKLYWADDHSEYKVLAKAKGINTTRYMSLVLRQPCSVVSRDSQPCTRP